MGRPREFDIEQALRIALDLFWRKGFDGTSINDLTRAMHITPPSFYSAFGNKEALFRRVVELYQRLLMKIVIDALNQKTTHEVVAKLLGGLVDLVTDSSHPAGCLIMNSALPVVEGHPMRKLLADQRQMLKQTLQKRFRKGLQDPHDLPASADPSALAQLVVTLLWGMAVEAQSGTSRAALHKAVETALAVWPTQKNVMIRNPSA